jgi:hypothetical protein
MDPSIYLTCIQPSNQVAGYLPDINFYIYSDGRLFTAMDPSIYTDDRLFIMHRSLHLSR